MLKKFTALILSMCLVLSLFSAYASAFSATNMRVNSVLDNITDQLWNAADKENENVLFVKNAVNPNYPDVTYGEAFDGFFAYPTWKYFEGTLEKDDEESSAEEVYDIVEFTGYCNYRGNDVKARLQFQLNLEDGTFFARALSFNDVPQLNLIMGLLIERVFENSSGEPADDDESTYIEDDYGFNQEDEDFDYNEDPIDLDELSGFYSGDNGECDISMYTSFDGDGSVGQAEIVIDDAEYTGTIYSYGTNLYGVITDEGDVLYLGASIGAHGVCMCVQMDGYTVGYFTMTEHYES